MEEWKWIEGFEGRYQVSTFARIRSFRVAREPRLVKPRIERRGYHKVILVRGGKQKVYRLHRLVAEAWIPNPQNKPSVNHKSGNKSDSAVSNLEWTTYSENQQHAWDIGLQTRLVGERNSNARLTSEKVLQIRQLFSSRKMTRRELAAQFGITLDYVSDIAAKRRWSHV